MSFLSSLFSGRAKNEKNEKEEKSALESSTKLKPGMFLKVYADGNPLLSGNITISLPESLTIERSSGQRAFGVCDPGAEVIARGDEGETPYIIKGTVAASSRELCRITNLKVLPYVDQRTDFRLPLDAPISFCSMADMGTKAAETGRLVNISAGGACVSSSTPHEEGETLQLKLQLDGSAPLLIQGRIVRAQKSEAGIFYYGICFVHLRSQDATALTKAIFNAQLSIKKGHDH